MARRGMLLRPPRGNSPAGMTSTNTAHGLLPPPTTPVTTSTEETQQ